MAGERCAWEPVPSHRSALYYGWREYLASR